MKAFVLASAGAALTLVALLALLNDRPASKESASLTVASAGDWGDLVKTAARKFEQDTGAMVAVETLDAGPSAESVEESKADLFFLNLDVLERLQADGGVREILPAAKKGASTGAAGVSATCAHPATALRFARYLASPEKGAPLFEAAGMTPIEGDAWSKVPKLSFFSGGVNRPAVEKLVNDFAQREGVSVTTVFNGCGILCATMQTMASAETPEKLPDAYYACDICFVPPVAEFFPEATLLTETDIGIVVREGNPRGVKSLADLSRPGLRVGLCNAAQSTLGYMTRGMLRSAGLLRSVTENVSVEVPTADFLINQMRAGGLDAAIVYRVNAQVAANDLEFLPINHPGAKAVQPFSVRAGSPRRQLASRLLEFLKEGRGEFEDAGFIWRGGEESIRSSDIEVPEWLKEPEAE